MRKKVSATGVPVGRLQYHRNNSERNANSSVWKAAGSHMYGAWLPFGMTTFRLVFTERISRSACV